MKLVKVLFFGLFFAIMLNACKKDYPYAGVGVEIGEIAINPNGDSVLVKTKGGYWQISSIHETIDTTIVYGGFSMDQDTVSIGWFTAIKMGKDVFVKVEPNDIGKDREVVLRFMKENYWDELIVTQAKAD